MKRPIKALIFSVSIGAGHDSVAEAISESLLVEAPGSAVKVVDTFQYINSVLHKVVAGSYMETIKFTPKVWGYLYDQAEDGERLVDLGQLLSKLLSPRLEQLLREFNPDIILTTHAFPTGMLAMLKRRETMGIPLASAVTDYHVHSFWIHHGVDMYFIPAPDLAYSLAEAGIAGERIKPVGIPIRSQFRQRLDREVAKERLGLNKLPAILVMGGGLGLGRIELIARELVNQPEFQVIVVAGKNNRLRETLERIRSPRFKVFGFVDSMAEVMTAADIIISKPGGVTTAEILALKKPLVIYSSLPGQEDRNTDYLLNKGAAIKVRRIDKLIPEIKSLWENPLRLRHMAEMAEQLGSPDSSRLLWENIWTLL
jgi:processive 1,2-diacylglycerol beta-glucosyltransferase